LGDVNTFSGTIGIGWDFPITDELIFRPILKGTLGRVASDLKVSQTLINQATDRNIQFLNNGALDAYGYGGSLMLDYEHLGSNSIAANTQSSSREHAQWSAMSSAATCTALRLVLQWVSRLVPESGGRQDQDDYGLQTDRFAPRRWHRHGFEQTCGQRHA
jgi:hypothetical protein